MNYAGLCDAYAKLSEPLKLPAMVTCVLSQRKRTPTPSRATAQDWQQWLRETIEGFAPQQGWLVSRKRATTQVTSPLPQNDDLLYGEVCRGDASLHFRQDGRGGWNVVELSELPAGAMLDKDASECIVEEMTFLATEKELGYLRYSVYWRGEEVRGMRRFAFRFVGFVDKK